MVHLRAFSFTDDSANVIFSNKQHLPLPGEPVFSSSLEPALQLVGLRTIQSELYQKLYFSSRMPFDTLRPLMSDSISKMNDYLHKLTKFEGSQSKRMFHYEVIYASVVALTPPGWVDALFDYGKHLLFEYAAEFAETLSLIMKNRQDYIFYTSHDLLRASFAAERFVALLSRHLALLIGGTVPQISQDWSPVLQSSASVFGGTASIVNQALRTLGLFESVLQGLGIRYGYEDPLNEFKMKSDGVRQALEAVRTRGTRNGEL